QHAAQRGARETKRRIAGRLQNRARGLAIELYEEHRPGGYETATGVQALQPGIVAEPIGQLDVDATEADLDRMHTARCPGRRPQAKTAVQEGVIILEAEIEPTPFGPTLVVALDLHVIRRRFTVASEGKLRAPDVVVAQLEEIDRHDGHECHRPGP